MDNENNDISRKIVELEQLNSLYKKIIDSLPIGIQVFDKQGISHTINKKQAELLGLPDLSVGIGKFNVLTDPYAIAIGASEIYEKVYRGNRHEHTYEYNLGIEENNWETKRETRIFDEKIIPIKGNHNEVEFVLAVLDDVTDKIKAEQTLKESEKKHKDFVNHSPDIIYKYSSKRGGLFWSNSVQYILGFSPEEIKENPFLWNNSIHADDKEIVNEAIKNYEKGVEYKIEYRIKTKEGKWVWLLDYFMHKTIIDDEVIIEGHATDITKRKEAEIALSESELRWKFAIEGNSDGLWDWNLITNEVFFSEQWKKMLGFSANEISDNLEEWGKRIHPDDKETVYNDINNHLSGVTDLYVNEHRVLCKDNSYKWILDRGKIVSYTNDNKPERMIGTHSDISKRKTIELALKESEKKLKIANDTKDKFFSIIAHDLKSPFSSLLGFSTMLDKKFDKFDTEKKKKFIRIIDQGLNDTYKLLENLLSWSRSQRGKFEFKSEKIHLYLFYNEINKLLIQAAENKSIKLLNQIPENIYVKADRDMLSTIIRNLISNAIKFTNQFGEIIVGAEISKGNQMVEIFVKDNGVGISKEVQSKIFDIAENTSTQGTESEVGTGLGLILCKEFVEKHNGVIWIESDIGKGSSFYFTIPMEIEN